MIDEALPRPQPIGVFPLPAGNLLIGPGPGHDEVRETLCTGKRPESFPSSLDYYRLALDGKVDEAIVALDRRDGHDDGGSGGDEALTRLNRLVLSADPSHLAGVDAALDRDTSPGLACHRDTVAYTLGLVDEPPSIPVAGSHAGSSSDVGEGAVAAVGGEFVAMARAAVAAAALERHDRGAGR